MKKHILSFQTVKEAEEAQERLCLLNWQSFDLQSLEPRKHGGQADLVLRSTDRLDEMVCSSLEATAKPDKSIWNEDAWADTLYHHTFYYSDLTSAQSAQEFLPWAFPAWSKVIPVSDGFYKICFGTEKELTEQEQRDWCWTYDPDEFEFNEHLR